MKTLFTLLPTVLITILACDNGYAGYDFNEFAQAIDSTYPIWRINGKQTGKEYGLELLFNANSPHEVEINNFRQVLNGQSSTLLACYGTVIPSSRNAYIIGTANEGPTFGNILLFDEDYHKVAEIESQKVVKIQLIDLLNDVTKEIITWEDHHYGTNTTRRVLTIYKVGSEMTLHKIFEHDVVDATFMPGGPHGVDQVIHYSIDLQSLKDEKKIVVINLETQSKRIFSWNNQIYE